MLKPTLPDTSISKQPFSNDIAIRSFVKTVKAFYKKHGRHGLPWRATTDPYLILLSEIMLQQTQVERVMPKYAHFTQTWPTIEALAQAPLSDVLKAWQGLGYNSRAQRLHTCAKVLVEEFGGVFPSQYETLQRLPGIGPYTAGAIMAFAFNKAVPLIETNVRTVYLHHFFQAESEVEDVAILTLVSQTLDQKNPRAWYAALMDYGTYLKKLHGNPNQRSAVYTKQSKFVGSDRQIRGQLIKLAAQRSFSRQTAHKFLNQFDIVRIDAQIERLVAEGLLTKVRGKYCLPR